MLLHQFEHALGQSLGMVMVSVAAQAVNNQPAGLKPRGALPVARGIKPRRIKWRAWHGEGRAKEVLVFDKFYEGGGALLADTAGVQRQEAGDARFFEQAVRYKIPWVVHFGVGVPQFL